MPNKPQLKSSEIVRFFLSFRFGKQKQQQNWLVIVILCVYGNVSLGMIIMSFTHENVK